jgi:hypothetical protein
MISKCDIITTRLKEEDYMEQKEVRKTVMETCKEYYEKLDRSGLSEVTPERGKEIFEIADIYRGMHEHKDFFSTTASRFESAIQKLISSKNDNLSLTNPILIENEEGYKHEILTKEISFQNDAEKILFIIRAVDPKNKMFYTWTDIVQKLTNDTDSFLISASNYGKARKIMSEYYNGFFNIRLLLDEQAYLIYKEQLLESNIEKNLKK